MRLTPVLALALALAACGRNEPNPYADNDAPVASAGPDHTVPVNVAFTLDGSESRDPDGEITEYAWNLGDGTTLEGVTVEHTYTRTGTFLVTLTVTDNRRAEAEDQVQVIVTEPEAIAVPDYPATGHVLEELTFDGTGSLSADPIVFYEWRFGDGQIAQGATVTHAYQRSGTFNVRLTVRDDQAREGVSRTTIDILPMDIDGAYVLTPSPPQHTCANYTMPAPDTNLSLIVAGADGSVDGMSAGGTTYDGTLDGVALDLFGSFQVPAQGGCAAGWADVTYSVDFDSPTHFTGSVLVFYKLLLDCGCSKSFAIEGTR